MLEERVIALSSIRWKQLEKVILTNPDYLKIKEEGGSVYFWMNNEKSFEENKAAIRSMISKIPCGNLMVYNLFPILNGKRDLFPSRMSAEQKRKQPYFQMQAKDITEKELQCFVQHENVILPKRETSSKRKILLFHPDQPLF